MRAPLMRTRPASDNAAAAANDAQNARKYYAQVVELASAGDGTRPEIAQAKAYIARAP